VKRVLFITYYFPPSGGSGVQRGLKMVKYLPDAGWEPLVLTVHPDHAAYPDLDPAMLSDVPKGTLVERTRSWDPYTMYARMMGKKKSDVVGVGFLGADHASWKERFARWVRANLFLPDARVGWVRHAVRAGRRLAADPGFDAIVSTGPPHSAHLAGVQLARETGLPWIADLRDAWPDPAYQHMLPTGRWARRRDERTRNRILREADVRVAVTEDLAHHMSQAVGAPFSVIRNGFDPDDMQSAPDVPTGWMDAWKEDFLVVHTGNLSPARDPEPLWKVLSSPDASERWPRLRLVFVGNVDPTVMSEALRSSGPDRVHHIPYVPHAAAVAWMKRASLLLLPINRVMGSAGIVTGKIYEYIASGRPVLAFGEPGGEADGLLKESAAGTLLDYTDTEGLRAELDRHYAAWQANKPVGGAPSDGLQPYSRQGQAHALAELLSGITSNMA
jgi:glycosyltransferase involved in cell wall biosynthesis